MFTASLLSMMSMADIILLHGFGNDRREREDAMNAEEIRQAMEYCYEIKPALCSECPLSELCKTIDADTLGELFAEAMKEGSKDNDV